MGGALGPNRRQQDNNTTSQQDLEDGTSTMDEMTTDEQQVYTPPPHLAARFYRNRVNARRKSSAASSRRNSLSSAHSRASSVSRRNASVYQSNCVAQHLRRASILESRKARLADRAAHAEQVRLRAALAKATPRGSTSASEERALAAQLAKEKYLAKVAAACAEEVARAKRIAEEVKERKLAEEARVRAEMEERHAEAERRRAEYQRNLQARRARRADSAEKKLAVVEEIGDVEEEAIVDDQDTGLSEEAAARRLQRAWRLSRSRAVLKAFSALRLDQAAEASFEDTSALIAKPEVIATATAFLIQLGLQQPKDENASLNSRTFLSAYLMLAHPTAVLLNRNGAQEQDLLAKATELLNNCELTVVRLAPLNNYTPSATQLETLSQLYSAYTSAFAAWRLQDSSVLIEGMVASFVELDAIWQTVKDDDRGEVASDYREGIRDNQVMLLSRIRKLAGAERADTLIKKAIRESRRRRPKRRNAAEVRPRGVESASAAEARSSTSDSVVTLEETGNSVANVLNVPRSAADVYRTLFTPMPSNRVLTHELAIDKDFRLTDSTADLRDGLYRAICAAMKQGFEANEGTLWTLSAAENVREKLLRMLKPGNSMHKLISDTLDLEMIARQSQAGIFSYEGFFNFMADILPKLCAPFRDAEIATLVSELQRQPEKGQELDMMIEKLFRLLRAVDTLSLDYTNFMLMSMAPTLIREAPGYEQRAFAADLEAGRITLERTSRWWRTAYNLVDAEAERRDPEDVRLAIDRPKPDKVYARALTDLAIDQSPLSRDALPETLHLDYDRLADIRAQAVRITIIGAILLTAKNLLKRDVRAQWKPQAMRLWQLLSTEPYTPPATAPSHHNDNSHRANAEDQEEEIPLTTAQKAFTILETGANNNLPPTTKAHLENTIVRFFAQAEAAHSASASAARFTDPVLKVLFQRLRAHVFGRLSAVTAAERVRAASSATQVLTSCGLGEVGEKISAIVEALERVRRVDWESHGGWYRGIVEEVEREGEGARR